MVGLIGIFLWAVVPTAASPADSDDDAPDRLSGVNPARLIPRLELRQRFTQLAAGGKLDTTTLRMDVVLFRKALLRFEMPLVVQRTAEGTSSGIGDLHLSMFGLISTGPRHAAILIGGVGLDSASRPQLGSGKQQVDFGGAAAFKFRPWWLA